MNPISEPTKRPFGYLRAGHNPTSDGQHLVSTSPVSVPPRNGHQKSGARKGKSVNPARKDKIVNPARKGRVMNPPAPHDNLLRPGSIHKDTPLHLGPKSLSKDIDALVERVRAVAMAENRPSTPGNHIDWAGEDDDSLPDLNDWGITSLSTTDSKTPVISPIIMSDPHQPIPSAADAAANSQDGTPSIHVAPSPSPQPTENSTKASRLTGQDSPSDEAQNSNTSASYDLPGSKGLARSIHAPPAARDQQCLTASVHASQTLVDASSSPAQLNVPRHGRGHDRPHTHTVGRPFSPNSNDGLKNRSTRNGRFHGSPKQHMPNHSSPPAATTHRSSQSRPILTGDAISRLARVVGNTTTKATPITSD